MRFRGTGFWIGAALLGISACAHTNPTANNDNRAGTQQPVPAPADNSQSVANTNPQDGKTDQSGASSDTSTTTASDVASADSSGTTTASATDSNSVASNDSAGNATTDANTPSSDSSTGAADNSGSSTTGSSANSGNVAQQKSDIISSADGSQPGIVQDYSYGELTISPEGKQHKGKGGARSVLSIDDKVPVFQGSSRASTNDLLPGTDIRVYYKNPVSGTEKEVIGVDIVAPAPTDRTAPPESTPAPGASGSSGTGP